MNKIWKTGVVLFSAAALALSAGKLPFAKADAVNGVVQSGSFLAPDAGWTIDGEYDRKFDGEFFGDSVFFNADTVSTSDGDKQTDSALYYMKTLSEGALAKVGVRLVQGEITLIFGANNVDSVAPADAQSIAFGTEEVRFGDVSAPYGFDIAGKRADISVDTLTDKVTVVCGENSFTKDFTLGTADGYFGMAFTKASKAKGNVMDVAFYKDGEVVDGDSFTDEATVAPANADAGAYRWKRVVSEDVGAISRVLRVVKNNELYDYGGSWPSELAYTGFEFIGGIGAHYILKYDLTLMRSGWFGFVFNANKVSAGERRINDNTVLSGGRTFAAFVDGKVNTLVFGTDDGTVLGTEAISYDYGRKMRVTMDMRQVGESETDLTMTFVYADDPQGQEHTAKFTVRQPLGGQISFSHSAEFLLSSLEVFDGEGKYLGGDDFSDKNTYQALTQEWFIGLTAADTLKNFVAVEDFGTYSEGTLNFNEKAGVSSAKVVSDYEVPAREAGVDTREEMFGAEIEIDAQKLGGSYAFYFGSGNKIVVTKENIAAVGTEGEIKSAAFVGEGVYTLSFSAKSTGEMLVEKDNEKVFTADFGDENAFVGGYGLEVIRSAAGDDISFVDFSLNVTGIPTRPTLVIEKPTYLAVGKEIDLTPTVMSDELDSAEDMDLQITVVKVDGDTVAVKDNKVTLPETGYYTVHYKLTNSHGLSAEDEFTARGIYRGEAENTVDKAFTDFLNGTQGWKVTSGTVASGKLIFGEDGSLTTEGIFIYFLADFSVKGGFEIVFGNCRDYENAFGIAVNADNTVTLRNLYAADGTRNATLARDLRLGEDFASVRLKVIGSTVTLYGHAADDPLKFYELASFRFESDMPMTYGTVSVFGGSNTEVSRAAVYSLDSGIEISPDDYDPADEGAGKHQKPVLGGSKGLIIGLSVGGAVLIAAIAVAVVFIVRANKKKKAQKEDAEK